MGSGLSQFGFLCLCSHIEGRNHRGSSGGPAADAPFPSPRRLLPSGKEALSQGGQREEALSMGSVSPFSLGAPTCLGRADKYQRCVKGSGGQGAER